MLPLQLALLLLFLPLVRNYVISSTHNDVKEAGHHPSDHVKLPVKPIAEDSPANELSYDNNYRDMIFSESKASHQVLPDEPDYQVDWGFVDRETIRIEFALISLAKPPRKHEQHTQRATETNLLPTLVSVRSHWINSIHPLRYSLFIIRQYKTNMEEVLNMTALNLTRDAETKQHCYLSVLKLKRLNLKERYSVCIYYYRSNTSIRHADLFICQDIINDYHKYAHDKAHAPYGLLFILTQYSIIFAILLILQTLFSIRKRRIAEIVHQQLISKAQRVRASFSSISFIRQSISSNDTPIDTVENDSLSADQDPYPKESPISPKTILSNVSIPSFDENQPFIKTASNKNHVQFLLGEAEDSDTTDENDPTKSNGISSSASKSSSHEPYGDQSDALMYMAHILDGEKPWSKYKRASISVC